MTLELTLCSKCKILSQVFKRLDLKIFQVLCIDEATASVDHDTDQLIQRTIRTMFTHSTVMTVAHRINTVLDCDRVLVMGGGRVLELAPPGELLADSRSHFYSLVHGKS